MDLLSEFPGAGENTGGDAFNVAIYVIVSMIVLVGITYLFSRLMNNRKLEDWSKNEFVQVLISAAIVGGLFILMAPGSGLITVAFNGLVPEQPEIPSLSFGIATGYSEVLCSSVQMEDADAICYAYTYLGNLSLLVLSLTVALIFMNTLLDIISKIAIDIIILEITPLSGLASIVQVLNSIIQSLVFLGIIVEVERALLQFVNKTALTIFLPIGVVLRTFFATRRVGGALIGLAIGMYIVFPLAIALNATTVNAATFGSFDEFVVLFESIQELSPFETFSQEGALLDAEVWNTYLGNFQTAAGDLVEAIASVPGMMTSVIAALVVQIVFLPILSVIITVIAIKELANLFGGEINLARFEV
jgi:hypothetical protein